MPPRRGLVAKSGKFDEERDKDALQKKERDVFTQILYIFLEMVSSIIMYLCVHF